MKRKSLLCLILSIFTFIGCAGCVKTVEESAEVYFFKTGKADCFLVQAGGINVLIDTAEDEDGEKLVDRLTQLGVSKIDTLVITHFDKDHVGGADAIIGTFNIGEILRPDYISDSKETKQYNNVLSAKGISDTVLAEKKTIKMGEGTLTLFPAEKIRDDTDNDNSIAAVFEYAGKSILFAADAEEARIAELLETEGIGDCDIIKMPHHGRFKENLEALLSKTMPEFAIITATDKNPPENETLELLKDIGCKTLITKDGDIHIKINKFGIRVAQD